MRKLHLLLCSHPTPTSLAAIDYALALAKELGARLDASSPRVSIRKTSHWLAGAMMAGIARELEQRAAAAAAEMETHFDARADKLGVPVSISHFPRHWPAQPGEAVWRGRTSDLCVLPLSQDADHRLVVEDWLFHTGRPCLIYPNEETTPFSLDTVLLCWDFSRSAARAIADALPLMKQAKSVRMLTVRGEKDLPFGDLRAPLRDYLSAHAIDCAADEIDVKGTTIGRAILDHASSAGANLIVMGAFGHSRAREFLLGGATKGVLDSTAIPILMSH